jgi:hypothetical protein
MEEKKNLKKYLPNMEAPLLWMRVFFMCLSDFSLDWI